MTSLAPILGLEVIPGIERIERGVRIPKATPQPPDAFLNLVRRQIEVLGIEQDVWIPPDTFASGVMWSRGEAWSPTITSKIYNSNFRLIDRLIEKNWMQLHGPKTREIAVSPIFFHPWHHEDDPRSHDGIASMALNNSLAEPFCIPTGSATGDNIYKLFRGFERESILAMVTMAVRMAIKLDLQGVDVTFNDPQFSRKFAQPTIFNPSTD